MYAVHIQSSSIFVPLGTMIMTYLVYTRRCGNDRCSKKTDRQLPKLEVPVSCEFHRVRTCFNRPGFYVDNGLNFIYIYSRTHVIRILRGPRNLLELHDYSNYRSSDYMSSTVFKLSYGLILTFTLTF